MRRKHIPTFAPVFGQEERSAVLTSIASSEYLTSGKGVYKFEQTFAKYVGSQYGVMVNSGSTALLVATLAMDWKAGDKVLVPACNFPTAISPLLWFGLIPVFVDCEIGTYNTTPQMVVDAAKKVGGIKGAILLHNLGNPLDPEIWCVGDWMLEDTCDSLGSQISGIMCGSFGSASTHSFYPGHAITTIEGGMVVTRNHNIYDKVRSIVSWGRDCTCHPGEDGNCGKRFTYEVDGVPYDHKYIVSNAGGNFKVMEAQGVLGSLQLSKEHIFRKRKHENFAIIYKILEELEDKIYLPKSLPKAIPAWFGFPITLKGGNRMDMCRKLEDKGVQTRMVFAGNVTRHPFLKGKNYEVPYPLDNSNMVMEKSFVVGCGQSISEEEAHYIGETVKWAVTG